MRVAIAGVLLLSGCDRVFQLSLRDAGSPSDAPSICVGGEYAAGRGGVFGACVDITAPDTIVLPAAIDTGDSGNCTSVATQTDIAATEVCVIAAQQIEITRAIRAVGSRPLVIVAIGDLTMTTGGSIDVRSRGAIVGAGASVAGCAANQGTSGAGGGGGAGGSLAAKGGNGGIGGGTGGPMGGAAGTAVGLDVVRGGCRGGTGGTSPAANDGGMGGDSGGAIYLIAGGTISVAGTIDASGGPGGGGVGHFSGRGSGGGGGGSGGLIGLDASIVEIATTARLSTNGGGGGGAGSGLGVNGAPGADASAFGGSYPWISTGGGSSSGGAGGAGGQVSSTSGGPGLMTVGGGGGGGGGGGVGFIRIYGETLGTGMTSPMPNL